MKTLTEYINESISNDIKSSIEKFAWGIIDEFNQEGLVGFSENDWKEYISGKSEPDYAQIVDAILAQYKEYAGTRFGKMYDEPNGKKAISLIKDYDKNKEEINNIILNAAKNYLESI